MSCIIKVVPPNLNVSSGNRGVGFPYDACEIPPPEICFLSVNDFGNEIPLSQENNDGIVLRCLE